MFGVPLIIPRASLTCPFPRAPPARRVFGLFLFVFPPIPWDLRVPSPGLLPAERLVCHAFCFPPIPRTSLVPSPGLLLPAERGLTGRRVLYMDTKHSRTPHIQSQHTACFHAFAVERGC